MVVLNNSEMISDLLEKGSTIYSDRVSFQPKSGRPCLYLTKATHTDAHPVSLSDC